MNRAPLRRPILSTPATSSDRRNSSPTGGSPPEGTGGPAPVQHLKKHWPWWVTLVVALILNYLASPFLFPGGSQQRVEVSYTFFKQQVKPTTSPRSAPAPTPSRARSARGRPIHRTLATAAKTVQDFSTVHAGVCRSRASRRCSTAHGVRHQRPAARRAAQPVADPAAQLRPDAAADRRLPLALEARRRPALGGGLFGLGKSRAKRYDQTAAGDHKRHLRRRGRHRRGQGRARRDRRLPEGPGEVHPPGRRGAQRRAAGRRARARARRCWPGPSPARPTCRSSAWAPASSSR